MPTDVKIHRNRIQYVRTDWYKRGRLSRVLIILAISRVTHLSQRHTLVNRFIIIRPLASPPLADMHYSQVLSVVGLGLANAAGAAAQAGNSTIPEPSPTDSPGPSPTSPTTSPTPTGDGPSFPGKVGAFVPYGCVETAGELSSFSLALSDGSMSLDVCAETCADSLFFAALLELVYLVLPDSLVSTILTCLA
jgi:hypothetical protein